MRPSQFLVQIYRIVADVLDSQNITVQDCGSNLDTALQLAQRGLYGDHLRLYLPEYRLSSGFPLGASPRHKATRRRFRGGFSLSPAHFAIASPLKKGILSVIAP
jgi:hypothetical protein